MSTTAIDRQEFASRLAQLRAGRFESYPADACVRYLGLKADFEELATPVRSSLLTTSLDWSEEERADARWLNRGYDDLAALGYRVAWAASQGLGPDHEHTRGVIAAALFFMGETVKWDISAAPGAPHDLGKTHSLMRMAMQSNRHRKPLRMRVDGRPSTCTVESLYFRVLLLARFASGALNIRQIEILDAWMWLWTPVLSGVTSPPPGSALRADLDSAGGLQRGPRIGDGASLYLPQAPIERAYRSVVAEFHSGQMVPAEGLASRFPIEEHVAVLELIARGLGEARRPTVERAPRRTVGTTVEIHIGLADVAARATAAPPTAQTTPSLSLVGDSPAPTPSRSAAALPDIYDRARRLVQLIDESDSGLGLEGPASTCGMLTAGDLIAVSTLNDAPPVLGTVVRCVPARSPGRVTIGVRRLPAGIQVLPVEREARGRATLEPLLFVPGEDSSGRYDAWLVSERVFAERSPVHVDLGGTRYTLSLNRVRDRGRGWVLAGFDVVGAVAAQELMIA